MIGRALLLVYGCRQIIRDFQEIGLSLKDDNAIFKSHSLYSNKSERNDVVFPRRITLRLYKSVTFQSSVRLYIRVRNKHFSKCKQTRQLIADKQFSQRE